MPAPHSAATGAGSRVTVKRSTGIGPGVIQIRLSSLAYHRDLAVSHSQGTSLWGSSTSAASLRNFTSVRCSFDPRVEMGSRPPALTER